MNGPPPASRPPGPALSRRGVLLGALAGAGAATLTGCATPLGAGLLKTESAPDAVEYWNLFGGGDGVRMQQIQDAFRKANPGTPLKAITLAWGDPYYTKLSLATVGEEPPDVAVSHLTRMKTLVDAGLLQELRPEDLARHGMAAENFNQRAWQAGLVDGRTYAIPLDTHPFVLFYNTDICQQAGLLDPNGQLKPITGEAAFVDALARAKRVTGRYGATHGINADPASPWRFFQTLYSQLEGEILADNGTRIVLDDAKAARVLDYLRALTVEQGLIPSGADYPGAIAMFATGQAGFHLNGEWEISTFQTAKMPFGMTLVPNIFGGPHAVQADSHTLILPARPDLDQARLDRALHFVRSVLDQSLTWAEGGHVPTWLPFAESEAYRRLSPQSSYAAAADTAVYDPPGWYSGSGSNFENVIGSAVGAVEGGQLTARAAIAQIRSQLSVLARTPSPV
ncbi:extracellular solute-binding protein [Plantactinospora endophytica]|uniref:Sugar ABC transporter substrate-binding protein n=1 Tax=Plantactinospora endophytica TaxID=673535 RepID=A0ABQ4DXJ8_9ACTN|nr:extracellular solute-binding protein [Plantactinospora endophytica]GIG87195.1 sugar ABC transporter substrate-binding protein [Plantactinospora endophytica]